MTLLLQHFCTFSFIDEAIDSDLLHVLFFALFQTIPSEKQKSIKIIKGSFAFRNRIANFLLQVLMG